MNTINQTELIPIVAQIIGQPKFDSLTWELTPLKRQGGQSAGVVALARVVGTAQTEGEIIPWSVVVKIIRPPDSTYDPTGTAHDPSAWNYWRREILVYQSTILTDLSENLVAPCCYGVTENLNGDWSIWLEDIAESPKHWTIERYGNAARHLGQFNGGYLTGRPLPPEQPWIYQGRSRDWPEFASTLVERFQYYAKRKQGRRWLSEGSVGRVHQLLANRQALQTLLSRLPRCLCHHDAHHRNLMARDKGPNELQTVAIDWSYLGYGGVGEEIGILTAVTLSWMDVAGEQASALDQAVFESYLAGLRDAGWQGDARLARFGYTASASLVTGVAWTMITAALIWPDKEQAHGLETIIGHSRDEIFDQQAMVLPFLLDLGDEALQLMASLP